jgi:hypothetical protein
MPSKKTPSKKTPKHGAPSKHFVAPTPLTLVRWHASSLAVIAQAFLSLSVFATRTGLVAP